MVHSRHASVSVSHAADNTLNKFGVFILPYKTR